MFSTIHRPNSAEVPGAAKRISKSNCYLWKSHVYLPLWTQSAFFFLLFLLDLSQSVFSINYVWIIGQRRNISPYEMQIFRNTQIPTGVHLLNTLNFPIPESSNIATPSDTSGGCVELFLWRGPTNIMTDT